MLMQRRIVLTGSWGGGKSTLLQEIQADPSFCDQFLVLPEVAPLVRRMGFDVRSEKFEKAVLTMQHALEEAVDAMIAPEDDRLVLSHRGSLDAHGFWRFNGGSSRDFFNLCGTTLEAELSRYDTILLLRTTAEEAPVLYEDYRRKQNRPSADVAKVLEKLLEESWGAHPRFFVIGNRDCNWQKKAELAKAVLEARLPFHSKAVIDAANTALVEIGYPSSQAYQLGPTGEFRPSKAAQERLAELKLVLPRQKWDSLIDIGCAKGMFIIWAGEQLGVRRAIGLDAAEDMVRASRLAVEATKTPATILHGTPVRLYPLLAPAELVLVLHCYHYLYFGSRFGEPGLPSHDRWFDLFARFTSDSLIFANPLSLTPEQVEEYRSRSIPEKEIREYCPENILGSAARHFQLQEFSLGGGRPYILMRVQS